MAKEKENYTKARLLLFLYGVSIPFVAETYNQKEQSRKYNSFFDGDYKRIDLDILNKICLFLNVSTGTVLDGLAKKDSAKVYLKDINLWIDFDLYILLRSNGFIVDSYNKEHNCIDHLVLSNEESKKLYERGGIKTLKRYSLLVNRKLTNPKDIVILNLDTYCHTKEKYFNLIKPYLSNFLNEDEIEIKTIGLEKYKKLEKKTK